MFSLGKYQTVEKARSLARRFAAEAHSALQLVPDSPFKEALEAIPQFILDREK